MTRAQSSRQELSIFQLILQSLHCQKSKAKFDLKFIQAKNINTSTLSISSLPLSQDPSWPGNFYFMLNFILDCQLLPFSLSPYSHLISSFTSQSPYFLELSLPMNISLAKLSSQLLECEPYYESERGRSRLKKSLVQYLEGKMQSRRY